MMNSITLTVLLLSAYILNVVESCYPASGAGVITVGLQTYICLTFNSQRRLPFLVEVDKMTSLGLAGSYQEGKLVNADSFSARREVHEPSQICVAALSCLRRP